MRTAKRVCMMRSTCTRTASSACSTQVKRDCDSYHFWCSPGARRFGNEVIARVWIMTCTHADRRLMSHHSMLYFEHQVRMPQDRWASWRTLTLFVSEGSELRDSRGTPSIWQTNFRSICTHTGPIYAMINTTQLINGCIPHSLLLKSFALMRRTVYN